MGPPAGEIFGGEVGPPVVLAVGGVVEDAVRIPKYLVSSFFLSSCLVFFYIY